MSNDLSGRHAVVTGGGTGIGAAIASAFVAKRAAVTLMGRRRAPLEETARRLSCGYEICDVTDPAAVTRAFSAAGTRNGSVDILVSNAGAVETAPFHRVDGPMLDRMMTVNVTGAMLCAQAVLPSMTAAGWGRIIAVSSTAGLKGYAYVSPYCAAKHAVIGLIRALALEIADTGVTANCLCPGYTDTNMVSQAVDSIVQRSGEKAETIVGRLVSGNPQKRLVRPDEVADAAVWLVGDGATAINGQALAIAGGEVM